MAEVWSRTENEAIVAEYLKMLEMELAGVPFVKAEYNRAVQEMTGRGRRAVEDKFMNLSAILVGQGFAYIDGYKPLPNYQLDLADVVIDRLTTSQELAELMRRAVEAPAAPAPAREDLLGRLVDPPSSHDGDRSRISEREPRAVPARLGVNWLEVESRNRSLGASGEEFVLEYERARLRNVGKASLSDRVEHVSRSQGDGLGFDVRSFERNGTDRLIEVKTTAFGKETPFFLSRNEVAVSDRHQDRYHLYRLFKFREDPRMYAIRGAMAKVCEMDPVQYLARPR